MGILRITIRKTTSQTESGAIWGGYPPQLETDLGRFPHMTAEQQLRALMEHGEEMGCINMSMFTQLVQELDLDDDELNGLYEQIEERGIELSDDCALPEAEDPAYVNSERRNVSVGGSCVWSRT